MTVHSRPEAEIHRAYERVMLACPGTGPGWSVCFRDAQDESVATFTLANYAQLQLLVDAVGPLGYALTVLDEGVGNADFVFRETSTDVPEVLARSSSPRPPRPAMPPASRGSIRTGDLVMQDCGGPIMLVKTLNDDQAHCVWFAEAAAVQSGTFAVTRLVNVSGAQRRLEDVAEGCGLIGE